MIQDLDPKVSSSVQPSLFSKKPLLQISQLRKFQNNSSIHIAKNKLSDKMNRRDIQFYDLYKYKLPNYEVNAVINSNFPVNGVLNCGTGKSVQEEARDEPTEDPIYGDLEVDDYNKLYNYNNFIDDQFGQSISIKVKVNKKTGESSREVKEDLTKVVIKEPSHDKDTETNPFS